MLSNLSKIIKYSKKIHIIRNICISISIILFIILIIHPYSNSSSNNLFLKIIPKKINHDQVQSDNTTNLKQAEFYGLSSKNEPLKIFASNAVQKKSDEVLLDNLIFSIDSSNKLDLSSDYATWEKRKFLTLLGNITVKTNDYKIDVDRAEFNIIENTLHSDSILKLNGSFGILHSKGFHLNRNNNILNFIGPVKLTINKL